MGKPRNSVTVPDLVLRISVMQAHSLRDGAGATQLAHELSELVLAQGAKPARTGFLPRHKPCISEHCDAIAAIGHPTCPSPKLPCRREDVGTEQHIPHLVTIVVGAEVRQQPLWPRIVYLSQELGLCTVGDVQLTVQRHYVERHEVRRMVGSINLL
jgi:hypothetical protein